MELKWLKRLSFVAPFFLLIALVCMGSTKGSNKPAIVLFPWALLGNAWLRTITRGFIIVAVLQYPLYGLILDITKKKQQQKKVAWMLLAIHALLALLLLVLR